MPGLMTTAEGVGETTGRVKSPLKQYDPVGVSAADDVDGAPQDADDDGDTTQ